MNFQATANIKRSFFLLLFLGMQVLLVTAQPTGKDAGAGWCPIHGNYTGASCPSCKSGGGDNNNVSRGSGELTAKQKARNEASDINRLGMAENTKARDCWANRDWSCAVYYFNRAIAYYRQAIEKNQKGKVYRKNLSNNEINLATALRYKEFDDALALLNKGQNREAEAAFRNYILKNPKDADAHYNLCVALWNQDLLEEAYNECNLALAIDAGIANAPASLIKIKKQYARKLNKEANDMDDDQDKEAELRYKKAIALDPTEAVYYYNLGWVQANLGKYKDAETNYRKAIDMDPSDLENHLQLGIVLFKQGNLKDAEAVYRNAIRLQPGAAVAYYDLAYTLAQAGSFKEAEENYRKAIELDPAKADYHQNLAVLLEKQGAYKEAAKEYENTLKIVPEDKYAKAQLDKLVAAGKVENTNKTVVPGTITDPGVQLQSAKFQGFDMVIDGKGKYFVGLLPFVVNGSTPYVEKVPMALAQTDKFRALLNEEGKIREEYQAMQNKLKELQVKKNTEAGNKGELEIQESNIKQELSKKEGEFTMVRFKQTEAIRNFHEELEEAAPEQKPKTKNGP